jgi:hypothetical protein
MSSQRTIQPRDCCGPTASTRESGIRPPSRATHPVPGQAITRNALGRHPNGTHPAAVVVERSRGPRPRTVSQAPHPTAIASNRAEKERPRTPSRGTPAGASTSGRAARPFGVVPPNQRMQPDAVPATEIVAILAAVSGIMRLRSTWCGAADAQRVGRARAAHWIDDQRPIQPRDCWGLTANACESGIRPPSRGTHPVPGQAITGNARGRHHWERIRPPSWWERNRRERARALCQRNASDRRRVHQRAGETPSDAVAGNVRARQHGWQVITRLWGNAAQPAHAA